MGVVRGGARWERIGWPGCVTVDGLHILQCVVAGVVKDILEVPHFPERI